MVHPCQALPHEIWINILNQVEDKKQLATCRLVCKQWNPIAEKAMFSKELEIEPRESFVAKLYYHLTKKPALALLIKNICISPPYVKSSPLFNELLKLVMTSSLEKLLGFFPTKDSEQLFYHIILSSPRKFNKIKQMPVTFVRSDLYKKCLYALQKSLENMSLSIDGESDMNLLDHLHLFTRLVSLQVLNYHTRDIIKLDLTLDRLQCATRLRLSVDFTEENYIAKSSEQMNAWLVQNVKIDERMKSTQVSSHSQNHWCNLAEYFVYKYPNLHFLSIEDMTLGSDIERILQATKHIPSFILEDNKCNSPEHLWTVGYMMKSPCNTVRVEYSCHLDVWECACRIEEACRKDETTTTYFMMELQHDTPHGYIKELLLSVGSGASVITKAYVDLVHWRNQDSSQDLLNFYDILRLTPAVQDLEFADATIKYQKLGSEDLILKDLKTLEIIGAKINYKVISQLGSIAPNLKHLAISSSLVVGRKEKSAIIMPHSNLSSLKFQIKTFDWEAHEVDRLSRPELQGLVSNEDKMNIEDIMYIRIKMELFPWRYYLLKPNSRVITMISKDEFNLHAIASRIVNIDCKSLSVLSFAVKNLKITLYFENGELQTPFEKSYCLKLEEKM